MTLAALVTDSSLGTFFECFVAESDGALVGYALPYHTFSCQGRGIYMEDLYVKPAHRGQGLGTALMAQVAQVSVIYYGLKLNIHFYFATT